MWDCVFCKIINGDAAADLVHSWHDAIAITPHHPVTPGHTLVIPRCHVQDAIDDPIITAAAMYRAADLARATVHPRRGVNLITSVGAAATQTVWHLHIHVVPRSPGDGLHLPWTGQGAD